MKRYNHGTNCNNKPNQQDKDLELAVKEFEWDVSS